MFSILASASAPSLQGLPLLDGKMTSNSSVPWTIVLTLTLITLIPSILVSMTPMVRLLIVFHFLRQALGTQTAPGNQTLMGLGLMMTWFLMQPVVVAVNQQAIEPYRTGRITGLQAIELGSQPPKHFMLRYAREKDLALFTAASQTNRPSSAGRTSAARGDSCVHSFRTEGRLPDWCNTFSPFSADRPGGCFYYDGYRHVPTAACGYFHAVEDSAFCNGGWLEPAGRIAVEEFLREGVER